ncbi:hypothetical protein R3P38DRAFT_3177716 [Favolaschia claudopus]|uniref:Uncharacterized protein n=1 Tax=Favolaschia claudopus TaxID=2862362 RepID=A0AAW0CWC3_9AGAR
MSRPPEGRNWRWRSTVQACGTYILNPEFFTLVSTMIVAGWRMWRHTLHPWVIISLVPTLVKLDRSSLHSRRYRSLGGRSLNDLVSCALDSDNKHMHLQFPNARPSRYLSWLT